MIDRFKSWAVLELFGHRKFAGMVQEVELAGGKFLRLDVPSDPPVTQFYGASAVYCLTPADEETCRRYASRNAPAPIARYELPALTDRTLSPEVADPVDAEEVENVMIGEGEGDDDDEPGNPDAAAVTSGVPTCP